MGLAGLLLTLSGCPEPGTDAETDADATDDEGETEGPVCDPVGADPGVGELLNAPVAADVEVIVKTPQHPGAPGPEELP